MLVDIKFLVQSLIDPRGIFKIPLDCHSHDTIASQMMGIHQLMLHYYNDNCKMIGTVRYQLRKYVAMGVALKYKQCEQLYQ